MEPANTDPIVNLEEMTIGYVPESVLLEGINLSVMPGELVALVGRNGTGKSTLLRSIMGLLPVMEGECRLFGASVRTYDLRRRARMVSYVSSQVPAMPSITVRELVSLGRMPHTGWTGRQNREDRDMVRKAVRELSIEHFLDRKVDQLSDGECHRAMIARAFSQDTPLMVLDEPTAFLDIPNKYELIRILSRLRDGGKSIIFSTHDLETAWLWADKFWVIHRGEIREGAPEDLGMRGVFDDLFADSGITFDRSERRFVPYFAPRGTVRLTGKGGAVMNWTRTALDRLGFKTDQDTGDPAIRITSQGEGYCWQVIRHQTEKTFDSIYSLARFLIQVE